MSDPPNMFAGGTFDRLTERRHDTAWLQAALASRCARFLIGWDHLSPVVWRDERPAAGWLDAETVAPWLASASEVLLLGQAGEQLFFGLIFDAPPHPEPPITPTDLRRISALLHPRDATLLAYFRGLGHWHRTHRFCGRCGGQTVAIAAGHERRCEACGTRHFPRVDPAIIVLVEHGDQCLLGSQTPRPPRRYSTLAGFVEPGESLEDALRREVFEEAGVEVDAAHCHSSQPWPFPASLMLGFHATARTTVIALRDGELQDARWFNRQTLADELVAGKILMTPRDSIAFRLIAHWFDRDAPTLLAELLQTV